MDLGMSCGRDGVVEGVNTILGELGFGAEIAGEVFRGKGLALVAQIEESPEEPFGRMFVNFNWFLDVPLVVSEADEDEIVAIQTHTEEGIERLAVLGAHVVKAFLDLLDNFLTTWRIGFRTDAV